MQDKMMLIVAMLVALPVLASPTSVVWNPDTLEATVTLPAGEHVVPADLWLGDATGGSKAEVVSVVGSGATAVFTNTYTSGLALLAEDARITFAAGVTARTYVDNYLYYGLLGDSTRARLDVGMMLSEGAVFEVPASASYNACLYLGVGGLTLTGATVVDRRLAKGNTTDGDICKTPFYNQSANVPRLSGLVTARACGTPSRIIAQTLVVRGGTVFEVENGA